MGGIGYIHFGNNFVSHINGKEFVRMEKYDVYSEKEIKVIENSKEKFIKFLEKREKQNE